MEVKGNPFFCSWSGGKDSCLALYYALNKGGIPAGLVTMLTANRDRSRSHGLSLEVLKKQSELLHIPLHTYAASWQNYEAQFTIALKNFKKEGIGIGVFGDIDIEDHKKWVDNVCNKNNISAILPLWKKSRKELVEEFIDCGFKAIIVAIKDGLSLDKELLGKELDSNLLKVLEISGVDLAGENGEYHTLVTGGPIFTEDIKYKLKEKVLKDGYWFQDVVLK